MIHLMQDDLLQGVQLRRDRKDQGHCWCSGSAGSQSDLSEVPSGQEASGFLMRERGREGGRERERGREGRREGRRERNH